MPGGAQPFPYGPLRCNDQPAEALVESACALARMLKKDRDAASLETNQCLMTAYEDFKKALDGLSVCDFPIIPWAKNGNLDHPEEFLSNLAKAVPFDLINRRGSKGLSEHALTALSHIFFGGCPPRTSSGAYAYTTDKIGFPCSLKSSVIGAGVQDYASDVWKNAWFCLEDTMWEKHPKRYPRRLNKLKDIHPIVSVVYLSLRLAMRDLQGKLDAVPGVEEVTEVVSGDEAGPTKSRRFNSEPTPVPGGLEVGTVALLDATETLLAMSGNCADCVPNCPRNQEVSNLVLSCQDLRNRLAVLEKKNVALRTQRDIALTNSSMWKNKSDTLELRLSREDALVKASASFLEKSLRQRATVHNQNWGCPNDANEMGILSSSGVVDDAWKFVGRGGWGACFVSGDFALKLPFGNADRELNIQAASSPEFNGDSPGAVHEGRIASILQRFASGPESLPGILHCAPVRIAVGTLMSRATGDLCQLLKHARLAHVGTSRISIVTRKFVNLLRGTKLDCTAYTHQTHVLDTIPVAVKKQRSGAEATVQSERLVNRIFMDPAQAIALESPFTHSETLAEESPIFRRMVLTTSYLWDRSDLYSVLFGVWHSLRRPCPRNPKDNSLGRRISAVDVEKMRLELSCDLLYQLVQSQLSLQGLDLIQSDLKTDNILVTANSLKTYQDQVKESKDLCGELGIYPVRRPKFTIRERMKVCGTQRVSPVHIVTGDLGSIRVLGREQTKDESYTPLPARLRNHSIHPSLLAELHCSFIEGTPQGSCLEQANIAMQALENSYTPNPYSVVMSASCVMEDIVSGLFSPTPPDVSVHTSNLRGADGYNAIKAAGDFLKPDVVCSAQHAYTHSRLVNYHEMKEEFFASSRDELDARRKATFNSVLDSAKYFERVQQCARGFPPCDLKLSVRNAIHVYEEGLKTLTRTIEEINGTVIEDSPKAVHHHQYASAWNQTAKSQSEAERTLDALRVIADEFKAFGQFGTRMSDGTERVNLSSKIRRRIESIYDTCPLGFIQALNGRPLSGGDFEAFSFELQRIIKYMEATSQVLPSLLEIISRCGQINCYQRPSLAALLVDIRTIYHQVENCSRF